MKYAFIKAHADRFAVDRMCELMQVSRSAYYAWCAHPNSKREESDRELAGELTALHFECKEAYGSVRLSREFESLLGAGAGLANTELRE